MKKMKSFRNRPGILLFMSYLFTLLLISPAGYAFAQFDNDETMLIPGQYIVTLKPQAAMNKTFGTLSSNLPSVYDVASDLISSRGISQDEVFGIYENALEGFAIQMDEASAMALLKDPRVARVEQNGKVFLTGIQNNPPWGLDRMDQPDLPLDKQFTYDTTASNVHIYIMDSGLRVTHQDFTNRVGEGFDAIQDGQGLTDCIGHGTHVAGSAAGSVYGVAKGATIHPVKVFGCSSTSDWATIIKGVDWVTANHVKPAVINMSLAGSVNASLDDAVKKMIDAGVFTVISAGNMNEDACQYSPAHLSEGLTVGASNESDTRWSSSNWGSCLHLFAPGENVESASHKSDTGSIFQSGTSMAAPYAAGVAALYLSDHPSAAPEAVKKALLDSVSKNKLNAIGSGSPNFLIQTNFNGDPTPNPSVTAAFGFTTSQLTVNFNDQSTANQTTIQSWQWDFGDSGTSTKKNPIHTYTKEGTYTTRLTVSDGTLSDTTQKQITVKNSSDYCASSGQSQSYESISKVQVGNLVNPSGASGYSDFTAKSAQLSPGSSVSVLLTPKGSDREAWKIWIDFNQNGSFEDSGEAVFEKSGTGTVTGNFSVPGNATGTTRMRVSMQYKTYPPACGNFQYGEVEDYTVRF